MTQPGSTYSVADYDDMLQDPLRTPAYLKAIAEVIRPGDVVVEIGAGTGYFSVAAARAGARMVYAIERSPFASVATEIVKENGCADRVRVIQGDAATVELPERGNVLLFDLAGLLPLCADAIPTVVAARQRLIEPGARLICSSDRLWAVPCGAPRGWSDGELALGAAPHGISRAAIARISRSTVHREWIKKDLVRAEPQLLAAIDYATVTSPDAESELNWTFTQAGEVHGIVCWFDRTCSPSAGYSTGPGAPYNVYGQPFMPFENPLHAEPGDALSCRIRIKRLGQGYLYAWDTRFTPAARGGETVVMSQSTLMPSLVASGVGPSPALDRTAPSA